MGPIELSELFAAAQKLALMALVGSILVSSLFAVIDFRLWPNSYERLLEPLGLGTPIHYVLRRFGFNRAMGTFHHPIDLGNSAAIVLGLIFISRGS